MNAPADFHLYLYGPDLGPIDASFEQAETRLVQLPHLHFEPDGSFLWAIDSDRQRVFGMIYDAASKIQYCEIRGCCDLDCWRRLCGAIAGDRSAWSIILQLPDQRMQDLQEFERSLWPDQK